MKIKAGVLTLLFFAVLIAPAFSLNTSSPYMLTYYDFFDNGTYSEFYTYEGSKATGSVGGLSGCNHYVYGENGTLESLFSTTGYLVNKQEFGFFAEQDINLQAVTFPFKGGCWYGGFFVYGQPRLYSPEIYFNNTLVWSDAFLNCEYIPNSPIGECGLDFETNFSNISFVPKGTFFKIRYYGDRTDYDGSLYVLNTKDVNSIYQAEIDANISIFGGWGCGLDDYIYSETYGTYTYRGVVSNVTGWQIINTFQGYADSSPPVDRPFYGVPVVNYYGNVSGESVYFNLTDINATTGVCSFDLAGTTTTTTITPTGCDAILTDRDNEPTASGKFGYEISHFICIITGGWTGGLQQAVFIMMIAGLMVAFVLTAGNYLK